MTTDAAHRNWWQIAEVVFGVPLLVAIALQLTIPIALPMGIPAPVLILVGSVWAVVGVILIIAARRELRRTGQPTDPGHPTSRVVTRGAFSISRNPMYLGAVCFLIGIAIAINFIWLLVLLIPAVVACHYILIAPEEHYLTAKFGDEYQAYAASVRRWIGRTQRPS
jgi:protein-S-isoprenylcysteine O-methyltransferase Ste14